MEFSASLIIIRPVDRMRGNRKILYGINNRGNDREIDGHSFPGRCPTGQASLVPTTLDICVFDGFQTVRIYELIYPAKNPWMMGLGYAVTRDVASFLRYQTKDDAGQANPRGH